VKKQKGMALVLVIIIMAVLTILGVALLELSVSEARFTARQDRRMQAYYLAKSGVDIVSSYILKNPKETKDILDAPTSNPNNELGNGTFTVDVTEGDVSGEIKVKGKGTVGDVDNTSTLVMRKLSLSDIIDKALYTDEPLDITNMKISGDIQSGGKITYKDKGNNAFNDSAYEYSSRTIQFVNLFPTNPALVKTVDKDNPYTITSDENYNVITIDNQGILTITTGGRDIILGVNTFNITGTLNIDASGGGSVRIYVNNSMTVYTSGLINNAFPKNLFIYLKQGSTFIIQANMTLNGYIIGPDATVEFQSDGSVVNGAVYSDLVRKNGSSNIPNGTVNYVPLQAGTYPEGDMAEYRIVRWEK
jgi:type II secretory pathway pseudopilin PulG